MPDLKNFTITHLGNASVSIPRIQFSGQVVDSCSGALLKDFSGANAVMFPAIMTTLTPDQKQELAQLLVGWLVKTKLGY